MSIKEIMEVKEAIEWIRNIPKIHLYIGTKKGHKGEMLFTNGVKDCTEKEYYKDIDEVISLLQQGEKCREYLKRILKRFNKIELADSGMNEETYRENMSSLLSDIACEIEQKYFPK